MNPIETSNLGKRLEGKPILTDLNISLPQGALYGLLGRNGAGKTTLIKTLMGLFIADSGSALVLGDDLGHGCPPAKRRTGYVAEGDILPSWARIRDLVVFERGLREEWHPAGLEAWLAGERLSDRRAVGALSKGIRKRLELELVLAGCPQVLLMDEPLSGLDPVSRTEFLESFMGYVADRKATVLISSHVLTDLERVCDRIGVLAGGRIAYEETMDVIKERGGGLEDIGVELIRKYDRRDGVNA